MNPTTAKMMKASFLAYKREKELKKNKGNNNRQRYLWIMLSIKGLLLGIILYWMKGNTSVDPVVSSTPENLISVENESGYKIIDFKNGKLLLITEISNFSGMFGKIGIVDDSEHDRRYMISKKTFLGGIYTLDKSCLFRCFAIQTGLLYTKPDAKSFLQMYANFSNIILRF
jgi:hypothetical protein